MMQSTVRGMLSLALCVSLVPSFGSTPAVGLIVADGSFQINHSTIWDNATLFSGNLVETDQTSTQMHFQNGGRASLASHSLARVFESHLELQKGIGQVETPNYKIAAAGLEIAPDEKDGIARVQFSGARSIVVAAYKGTVNVTTGGNVLVARVEPGHELAFEPSDNSLQTKVSGCLKLSDGKFTLVDQTTGVKMELRGAALDKEVGNQLEISGTADTVAPSAPGTSQIVYVSSFKRIAKGACAGGSAVAAAAAAGGLSGAAIAAIVGGVAVAGSLVGLAVVHDLPGQSQSHPTTSR